MKTRIKELRQEKNYTQELLALKIGANQTTLSRIECELTIPDADLLIRLSGFFHVSIDYILCLTNQRSSNDAIKSQSISAFPKYQSYISLLQKLSPNQRIHLCNFLESIQVFY